MRIAFLSPSGQMGGAETCLIDAFAVLRDARPQWSLSIVLGEDGPLASRAAEHGAEVHLLPFPSELARLGDSGQSSRAALASRLISAAPSVLRYRYQLQSLLTRIKPDVVHTNGFKMHVLGALAKPLGSALVWHIHDYISTRPVMAGPMRRLASRTNAIITNSKHVAEDTRNIVGKTAHIVPVLNVVDLQGFTPEGPRVDLDDLSGLPPATAGTVRVGLIATLAWWKGHRLFLQGMAGLNPSLQARGYYIGGALYKTQSQESLDDLRAFAREHGISDRVGFTGVISQPSSAMRALDVLVHTSTEPEPFGRVIVEAMACGKPVITTGIGGAAEIISLGDMSLKINATDPASLTGAIAKLAADPELRHRLGSNGLSTARRYFGRERLARELPPVYEEVLSKVHGPNSNRAAHA
ncbi:MAG: glycosyltransferase family 4 protein [Terriglobales bacterium]